MTETQLNALADLVAARIIARIELLHAPRPFPTAPTAPAAPEPIPHKLSVDQFAWCVERSAYFVNEQTRINPKLRAHVQGKRPKLIHPAALALFGVDPGHAALRLRLFQKPSPRTEPPKHHL